MLASATAPVNIATVKYWGKRDTRLNLPTNSSVSVTLDMTDLRARTTVRADPKYTTDRLVLNGKEAELTSRAKAVLKGMRQEKTKQDGNSEIADLCVLISSENNFPTAAGLASSAAGFAALVKAVALLYKLKLSPEQLSIYARQGSGSACRSLMGGYVAWDMGTKDDGSDSRARQISSRADWPEMRAAILVASDAQKDVSSTAGMQTTVATSALFGARVNQVPKQVQQMTTAVKEKNFPLFAKVTMAESNQFHAVCLDTEPPIFYMTDVSRAAIRAVETINERAGEIIAAYTFDAGPNCVVYYLEENREKVLGGLGLNGVEGFPEVKAGVQLKCHEVLRKGIQRVILTGVGDGACETSEHLEEV